jgi:O-antigen ligase
MGTELKSSALGLTRPRAAERLRGGTALAFKSGAIAAAGLCVGLCLFVGYLVAQPSVSGLPVTPKEAALAIALLPIALLGIGRPHAYFLAAVVVAIAVPHTLSRVWLLPPILVGVSLLVGQVEWRPTTADVWFAGWLCWLLLRWLAHPELGITVREFAPMALGLGFYAFARITLAPSRVTQALWWVLAAGTAGAATVIFEWLLGHVVSLFNDPSQYQWAGSSGEIYRPGGVFGGSPAAAIALAVILLSTLALARQRPWLVRACQAVILFAIVITWARAGWVGLAVGAIVCALLVPYRRTARTIYLLAAVGIVGFLAHGSIQNSQAFREGVVRAGATTGRITFLRQSWPLATDSYQHMFVGRGFRAFMHPKFGQHDAPTLDNHLLLDRGGPHNDYMRTVLEEGVVGLVLLLGFLAVPIRLGVRGARSLPPSGDERLLLAGLTGAAVCYAAAALFHDLSNNTLDLTVGALVLGLLVTSTQRRQVVDGDQA